MPSCTIAIPVYNRVDLIADCVASALAQPVAGLEVLVVDNCSTDGTWELLQRLDDRRLRLVRNERNLGLFGNFNRCLELAQSPYLRFLCSDDRLPSACMGTEVAFMEAHPEVALLSTLARYCDIAGHPLGTVGDVLPAGVIPRAEAAATVLTTLLRLGVNPFCYPSGVMLRTSAMTACGRFDSTLRIAGDVDLFLRVVSSGDLAISRSPGAVVTAHAGQESRLRLGSSGFVHLREHLALVRRHRPAGAWAFASSERVAAAIAAQSLWFAAACFARRSWAGCRAHASFAWRIRRGGVLAQCLTLLLSRARYYLRPDPGR